MQIYILIFVQCRFLIWKMIMDNYEIALKIAHNSDFFLSEI